MAKHLPLHDIQANILKGHGRTHAWCVFVQFASSREKIYTWFEHYLSPQITSAERQIKDSLKHQATNFSYDGGTLLSFSLSANGYKKLEAEDSPFFPKDESFRLGMRHKSVREKLTDAVYSYWEIPYRKEMDAMILLADNSEERLAEKKNEIFHSLWDSGTGEVYWVEKGKKLPGKLEHFGYVDGISQPEFVDKQGELIEDYWKIVLVEEGKRQYGSYFVYRKLRQDVEAFNRKIRALAAQLEVPNAIEFAEAQLVGRFKDGTPLSVYDRAVGTEENDFDYSDDPAGLKCPFHAHIRKSNPRTPAYKYKRIARRVIPFDQIGRKADLSDEPKKGVGLLFMSYQASIVEQFEHIHAQMCDEADFPHQGAGLDSITDQRIVSKEKQWNKAWNQAELPKVTFSLSEVVWLIGGEYFYTPSISFLKKSNK